MVTAGRREVRRSALLSIRARLHSLTYPNPPTRPIPSLSAEGLLHVSVTGFEQRASPVLGYTPPTGHRRAAWMLFWQTPTRCHPSQAGTVQGQQGWMKGKEMSQNCGLVSAWSLVSLPKAPPLTSAKSLSVQVTDLPRPPLVWPWSWGPVSLHTPL